MSTTTPTKTRNKQAKYKDVAASLRQQILRRQLRAGERLPSFDEVCTRYNITPNTVVRVYGLLEQEGLIERQRGRGIFVAERRRKLTGNIGVVGYKSLARPQFDFHNQLMHGMESVAVAHQQHFLFLGTEHTWDVASCEKIDGLLVVGVETVESFMRKVPADLPAVTLFTSALQVPSVTIDDYLGAKLAVQYLHQHGHRRIACLMEEIPMIARRRFAGYRDALEELGIVGQPGWIRLEVSAKPRKPQPYLLWAREQMATWLHDGWHEADCTAIFVQNDVAAIGVMQILQEEGIRVPDEVSVIGFDGTALCDYVSPRLCAVEVPLAEMGAKAMELINQRIYNGAADLSSSVLPLRIREGASVATVDKSTFKDHELCISRRS